MSAEAQRSLFYEEDLVALVGEGEERLATVVRTWHEDDEDDDDSDDEEGNLEEDEYIIEWLSSRRQKVAGQDLTLMDRSFQVGDVCKSIAQSESDILSGVITDVRMEVAVTASKQPDWIPTTSVSKSSCIEEGDHVIYNNWMGVVVLVSEEALLTVRGSNRPYKVNCIEGFLSYGPPSESLLDVLADVVTGRGLGSHITPTNSKVIAVRQTAVFVTWLAVNQKVS